MQATLVPRSSGLHYVTQARTTIIAVACLAKQRMGAGVLAVTLVPFNKPKHYVVLPLVGRFCVVVNGPIFNALH